MRKKKSINPKKVRKEYKGHYLHLETKNYESTFMKSRPQKRNNPLF